MITTTVQSPQRTTPLMSNASNVIPPLENRSTLKPTVGTISDALVCAREHRLG